MDITPSSFTRFSRHGHNLGRLHVRDARHSEGLDGTDTLEITCTEDLTKNEYIVWRDRQGVWHEHIVDAFKRTHDDNGAPLTVATCINSIAETWDDYVEDRRPSGSVQQALTVILTTSRWTAGTCTQEGTASHTFYHISVREAIQALLEVWGGELETVIHCDGDKVTSREVRVRAIRGDQHSAKRFTWSKDLVTIARSVASDNPKTRLYAYGKGEETDSGGYGRRIGIEGVNPTGMPYVEDAEATAIWGHPMPDGTIKASEGVYLNDQCEDPAVLLQEVLAALEVAKVPVVTYEADVVDLVSFGRDWEDVALGDLVAIIDREFSDEGLRLQGRVSKIERDLLTYDTSVTFGTLVDAIANPWQKMQSKLASLNQRASNWDMAGAASIEWLEMLVTQLNAAYDQAGTYHYSSFEKGEIWSSVPLDDDGNPTRSGGWAMNINGLGFRLASGTNADGSWNWRTFGNGNGFTADEINAGAINAALITTGILSAPNSNLFVDLDTGTTTIGGGATVGDRTVSQLIDDVDATITNVDVEYAQGTSDTEAPSTGWSTTAPTYESGKYIWTRTATTTPAGTSYSTPVMISGRDGRDGNDGNDGVGISSIVEQYLLTTMDGSTPALTPTGNESGWSTTQPTWEDGKYIWTRTYITWDTTPATTKTTNPVLAKAINGANKVASDALDTAEETATLIREYSDGVLVCKTGKTVGVLVNAEGRFEVVKLSWTSGNTQVYVDRTYIEIGNRTYTDDQGYTANRNIVTIGSRDQAAELGDYSFVIGVECKAVGDYSMCEGYQTKAGNYAHAEGRYSEANASGAHAEGALSVASGDCSHAEGSGCVASGPRCHAEGYNTKALGHVCHAEGSGSVAGAESNNGSDNSYCHAEGQSKATGHVSHAEGNGTATGSRSHAEGAATASGSYAHAEGLSTASHNYSHASGFNTKTGRVAQSVVGQYNATASNAYLVVGNGSSDSNRSNALIAKADGGLVIAGTLTQSSDRRLKEHIAYIGDEAADFVRGLKPALYRKDGQRQVGFYAQDVQEVQPHSWNANIVTKAEMSEIVPDMLTLDYSSLIAPLVAYCQQLEKRIAQLEVRRSDERPDD